MTRAEELRAFREALKTRRFRPVYYFHGAEEELKIEAIRELVAAAVEPAVEAFNLDQRKGGDLDAETLSTLLATPPMLAERRVIVLRDIEMLRKNARAALDAYLAHPSTDVVVVLVSAPGAKTDKALTVNTSAIEFEPLSGAQLPRWIANRVKQAGGAITDGAISLLEDVAGSDLAQLGLEIEKLASYAGSGPIDEAAIGAVVGVRRDETLGHLLDAVAQRDLAAALDVLPHVLQQPKSSAVTIVMALTVQMLAIGWGQATGYPPNRLAKEYFTLLKESGSVYTGRAWGEAVASWTRAASRWPVRDIDHALRTLSDTDAALKETRLSNEEQLLTTLVLTVCQPSASQRAA